MILIRCNDIENWNIIQENHKNYFLCKVKCEIQKEISEDKNSRKYLLFKELFLNDQDEIDDEKILKIAIGNKEILDEIVRKYRKIIFNEDDEIKYELINKFINNRCKKADKIRKSLEKLIVKLKKEEQEYFNKFIEKLYKLQ